MLDARPRPSLVELPYVMDSWTIREYVHLAWLRAQDANDEDRSQALAGVLYFVDWAEKE